jgi:hypothetical protein
MFEMLRTQHLSQLFVETMRTGILTPGLSQRG